MSQIAKWLVVILFCWCHSATAVQYIAIIDAGSTGSRLHLYQYHATSPTDTMPELKEIFRAQFKPGLDRYFDDPTSMRSKFEQLLRLTAQQLEHTNSQRVPLYLFATGGLRSLPRQKQQHIFQALRPLLSRWHTFELKKTQTITGQQEAIYGWLAANDVYHRLGHPHQQTIGLLDLGGASMEVAFAGEHQAYDASPVCINHRCYWVVADSILGIGIEQSYAQLLALPAAEVCIPKGSDFADGRVGGYNFQHCVEAARGNLADRLQTIAGTIPVNKAFVATSGFYYTHAFFGADDDLASLDQHATEICEKTPWTDVLSSHSETPNRIRKYCFASALIKAILTKPSGIGFSSPAHITYTKYYHQQDISWARGAALYQLAGTPLAKDDRVL